MRLRVDCWGHWRSVCNKVSIWRIVHQKYGDASCPNVVVLQYFWSQEHVNSFALPVCFLDICPLSFYNRGYWASHCHGPHAISIIKVAGTYMMEKKEGHNTDCKGDSKWASHVNGMWKGNVETCSSISGRIISRGTWNVATWDRASPINHFESLYSLHLGISKLMKHFMIRYVFLDKMKINPRSCNLKANHFFLFVFLYCERVHQYF